VTSAAIDLVFQDGVSPAEAGVPEPAFTSTVHDGICIERNQPVRLGEGATIYVDVYRPDGAVDIPPLIAWGPYGKHNGGNVYQQFSNEAGEKGAGVRAEWISPYTTFEGPDPAQWCRFGYAVINVDPRATWWSEGDFATIWDEREARDAGEVIAWAGSQTWSSGKVGMTGVSYLAVAQWWAASLRPPHLAAINPVEGVTDVYREFAFHGGVPSAFPGWWQQHRLRYSTAKIEAMGDMMRRHPLYDAYWEGKLPDLANIEVPAYVIASWSDHGLHTRGTLAGFEALGSEHKFLEVHGRKKWEYFHQPATVARQRLFFDHFLKGADNEVTAWPRIRLETRTGYYEGVEARPSTWPPAETTFRTLHLDAADMTLTAAAPTTSASASYDSTDDGGIVTFRHHFEERTDIIGGMRLHAWMRTDDADDIDLFVAVKKVGADGEPVHFAFANVLERGPVALGWLRASHRALDEERSTANRPWHPHSSEVLLTPDEPVELDVEIWPSATRFEPGETLELCMKGADFYTGAVMSRHADLRNRGTHTVLTGPARSSYLVIPVVPSDA
jgi:predicted acyl esterase